MPPPAASDYRRRVRTRPLQEFTHPEVVGAFLKTAHEGLRTGEREFAAALAPADSPVLDLGCGAGREAAPLCDGVRQVVAADLSHSMLAAFAHRGIPRVQCDAQRLPFRAASFGAAMLPNLLVQYIPFRGGRRRALVETRRVLRPGGRAFVEVRHWGVLPLLHSALPRAWARWLRWSLLPAGVLRRWITDRRRRYDAEGPEPGDLQGVFATRTMFHDYGRREFEDDLRAAGFRGVELDYQPALRGPKWMVRLRRELNPWAGRAVATS